ncbi:cholinesterase-like isoform X2 [Ptychodera flava]|uniref:cholinesterase-like isoform X2 n=1 Tax=Ptychodera flava TaxID=63121 RepID=UPI00396A315C
MQFAVVCPWKIVLLAIVIFGRIHSDEAVVQRIRWGALRGNRVGVLEGQVDEYLGIPYAEPPVGDLRFAPPKPWRHSWDRKRNAKEFRNNCWQKADDALEHPGTSWWYTTESLSEDCLFLNIWVPYPRQENMAVMVWIHGGSFNWGTANVHQYNGKVLATTQNVIVVTMNYRLGPFGFLALGIPEIPGNMGLMDQVMALGWIKDNIASFGGDPDLVTIFGSSAGGASVGFHLLSPMSRDLFNRAIVESGVPNSPPLQPVVNSMFSVYFTNAFINNLGCATEEGNETAVLACLRRQSAHNITHDVFADRLHFTVVDGTFVNDTMPNLLKSTASLKNANIIIGYVKNEGMIDLVRVAPGFSVETQSPITYEQFRLAVTYIVYGYYGVQDSVKQAATFQYTDWADKNNPFKLRNAVNDLYGDYIAKCPSLEFANVFSDAGNEVYYYELGKRSSASPWPSWMGTVHGDEISYVFGHPLIQERSDTDEVDIAVSRQIMEYWGNFAKYGNPNTLAEDNNWPRYTAAERQYVKLDGAAERALTINDTFPRTPYCEFWQEYIPTLEQEIQRISESKSVGAEEEPIEMGPTERAIIVKATLLKVSVRIKDRNGIPYVSPPV